MVEAVKTGQLITGAEAAEYALTEHGSIDPVIGKPLDGPMNHRGVITWANADHSVFTGLWECDAGRFRTTFGEDGGECIHVVSGTMTAHSDDGTSTTVGPGDVLTFTPGWSGIWECHTPFRKFYTIFKV